MSRVLTQRKALEAYDAAMVHWHRYFAYHLFASVIPAIGTSKSLTGYSFDGTATSAHRWTKIDFDFWEFFLGTTTRGHVSSPIWLTFEENPFVLRGPFFSNLRETFGEFLPRYALPQDSQRIYQTKKGQFRVNG